MRSRDKFLEFFDNHIDGLDEPLELNPHILPVVRFDVFSKYLKADVRVETNMVGDPSRSSIDLEPNEFIFTAEKVTAIDNLIVGDLASGIIGTQMKVDHCGSSSDNTQSSVPIMTSQVVDIFESSFQPSIRVTDRFFSRVRLYRFEPLPKLVREWKVVKCTVLEIPILSVENRKFQSVHTICIAGRLGSANDGYRFPNETIQSRTQLIGHLSKFEREGVAPNSFNSMDRRVDSGDEPPALLVIASDGGKGVFIKEGFPLRIESMGVIFRSINPAPAVFESRLHERNRISGKSMNLNKK
jgi:hypothetical protein